MRVGIIGAGQLGLMLGQTAEKLDIDCVFLDPSENPPATRIGPVVRAAFDDADALKELASRCDVLTYEFENVPVDGLANLEGIPVFPPLPALSTAQDRLSEKQLFERLSIPLPAYAAIDSRQDLDDAIDDLGLPIVLKTRRFGYDGKGQAVIRNAADADTAWQGLAGQALIAESWVDFDAEVSAIAARSKDGAVVVFPLTQNRHSDGILDTSRAPCEDANLARLADDYVRRLLHHFDYVGTVALELFVCGQRLLANEFAPRVHNSGHWTIEGCTASQFENHMRAVSGLPLVPANLRAHAGMKNLVGSMPANLGTLADAYVHDYGKSERPGRKLGHITVTAATSDERDAKLADVEQIVTQ